MYNLIYLLALEIQTPLTLSIHYNEIKFYYIIHSFLCQDDTLRNDIYNKYINLLTKKYINSKCSIDNSLSFFDGYNKVMTDTSLNEFINQLFDHYEEVWRNMYIL